MKRLAGFLGVAAIGLVTSCGGSSSSSGSTGGSSSGSSGNGSSSGSFPAGGTLAGTWDLTGSQGNAAPTTGVLVIDDKTFNITIGQTSLVMIASGDTASLTWNDNGKVTSIGTTHASGAMALGAIPLAFTGGNWTFQDASGASTSKCTGTVAAAAVTGSCANVGYVSDSPIPHMDGGFTAARTATADSIFGDLGGEWTLTAANTTITAKFAGSSFTATATHGTSPPSTLTVTVGDGLVSGTSTDGAEFSARRR